MKNGQSDGDIIIQKSDVFIPRKHINIKDA